MSITMQFTDDTQRAVSIPSVLVLAGLLGSAGVAMAQTDAATADEPAVQAAQPQTDTEGPAAITDDAEELQPIVLEDRDVFTEEVYLDDVDEQILDVGPRQETDADRLSRLFVLYLDAVSNSMFSEADALAKQIVELTIQAYGLDSHESSKALTNLAIAQHGMEDYDAAILNYTSAIGIIERVEDRLNRALINPLRGLGAAQLASGRPDLARSTFDRAVHVSHVNDGPHNLGQVETLQSLAETYIAIGEFDDAVDIQKRIYYLQARNVDSESTEIVPALETRAEWQHRMGLYEQERYTWRRIISVLEKNHGKDSLSLIHPLTELGNSYLFVGYSDAPYAQPASVSSGEIYLKRAVRVAEANPEAGWKVLSDAMLVLGDYYTRTERPNRGHRVYREVWKRFTDSGDEAQMQERFAKLETVTVLQDITPPKMYGGDPAGGVVVGAELPGYEIGTATYDYSVSTRGRAVNVRIMETDPDGLDDMYQSVGRQLRRRIHRPRFADGDVVQTDHMSFSHSFYYREADLPNVPEATAQTDENGTSID